MRYAGLHETLARLLQGNGASLGDERVDALVEEGDGGADGWVACKGDLCKGQEYVDVAGLGGFRVGDIVDEDGLGEVEFSGDGLLLSLGGRGTEGGWDGDYGERVAAVGGSCEDIEGDEGEFGGHFGGC